MGLGNNLIYRNCGNEEENSVHILCECEALASLRHTYLRSFFLEPKDIRKLGGGQFGALPKEKGPYNLV